MTSCFLLGLSCFVYIEWKSDLFGQIQTSQTGRQVYSDSIPWQIIPLSLSKVILPPECSLDLANERQRMLFHFVSFQWPPFCLCTNVPTQELFQGKRTTSVMTRTTTTTGTTSASAPSTSPTAASDGREGSTTLKWPTLEDPSIEEVILFVCGQRPSKPRN